MVFGLDVFFVAGMVCLTLGIVGIVALMLWGMRNGR